MRPTITETGGARRNATAELNLRVTPAVPAAYNAYYDADYDSNPQLLAICPAGCMSRVSEQASWETDEYGLAVVAEDLLDENNLPARNAADRAFSHIGFSVDFEVSGLEFPGQSIQVVALVARHKFTPRFSGFGRMGLLRWKASYELSGVDGSVSRIDPKGTDILFGLDWIHGSAIPGRRGYPGIVTTLTARNRICSRSACCAN